MFIKNMFLHELEDNFFISPNIYQAVLGWVGFTGGASGKEPTPSAGDMRDVGSVPG